MKTAKIMTCLFHIGWASFVTGPMWFVILYQILQGCNASPWVWSLYWCYIPAWVVGFIFAGIFNCLASGD